MAKHRTYIQARNLKAEATKKLPDFKSIMGTTKKNYDALRTKGVKCKAFNSGITIEATKQCWNHVFKHPIKRPTKIDKIERALCFPMALKLLKLTTTYQEVNREKDKGGNQYLYFGLIGYVRGNRTKVVIRKQEKSTNPKYILFSFYQMSQAPSAKPIGSGRKRKGLKQRPKTIKAQKTTKITTI